MTLSTALQSIYNSRTDKNQPEVDNDTLDTQTVPGDNTDLEMVNPTDAESDIELDSQPATADQDPTSTLMKSLITWIMDNSDTIHAYLDQTEGETGDDTEFDDFEHFGQDTDELEGQEDGQLQGSDDDLNQDPSQDPSQFKEFEEQDKLTQPSLDGEDQNLAGNDIPTDAPADMSQSDELGGEEDPDKQGDIRFVPNAHLVYKRQTSDGTFEELWFFNSEKDASRSDEDIKKDILAGTDIDPTKISSEDGKQQYTIWSIGNGQMIQIIGLAN